MCFFKEELARGLRGSGHLAMIVARGGTLSELTERGCCVSFFELGLVIRLSPCCRVFFVLRCSHFVAP